MCPRPAGVRAYGAPRAGAIDPGTATVHKKIQLAFPKGQGLIQSSQESTCATPDTADMPMAYNVTFSSILECNLVDVLGIEILGLSLGQHYVAAVQQIPDLWSFHWAPHLRKRCEIQVSCCVFVVGCLVSTHHGTPINDSTLD